MAKVRGDAKRKRLVSHDRGRGKSEQQRLGVGKGDTQEQPVEVLPKRKVTKKSANHEIQLEQDGYHPNVGAGSLCDAISTALLAWHMEAIQTGERGDGPPQEKLNPNAQQGTLAKQGKRPNVRGWTGGARALPLELTRTEIRATGKSVIIDRRSGKTGTTAHANVQPGGNLHDDFLKREHDERGIEYLFVTGEAEKIIDATLVAFMETYDDEKGRNYTAGRIKAKDL